MTRNIPASNSRTMRLPSRRTESTRLPTAALSGGSKLRTTNGLATRTPRISCPCTRAASASTYMETSGSSGIEFDQLEDVAVRVLEVARAPAGDVVRRAQRPGAVALDQRAHLVEIQHPDAHHRPASIVASPLQRLGGKDGAQREEQARPHLQLDPAGAIGSLG